MEFKLCNFVITIDKSAKAYRSPAEPSQIADILPRGSRDSKLCLQVTLQFENYFTKTLWLFALSASPRLIRRVRKKLSRFSFHLFRRYFNKLDKYLDCEITQGIYVFYKPCWELSQPSLGATSWGKKRTNLFFPS